MVCAWHMRCRAALQRPFGFADHQQLRPSLRGWPGKPPGAAAGWTGRGGLEHFALRGSARRPREAVAGLLPAKGRRLQSFPFSVLAFFARCSFRLASRRCPSCWRSAARASTATPTWTLSSRPTFRFLVFLASADLCTCQHVANFSLLWHGAVLPKHASRRQKQLPSEFVAFQPVDSTWKASLLGTFLSLRLGRLCTMGGLSESASAEASGGGPCTRPAEPADSAPAGRGATALAFKSDASRLRCLFLTRAGHGHHHPGPGRLSGCQVAWLAWLVLWLSDKGIPRRQSFPRLFFFSDAELLHFLRLFGKRSSPKSMELLARQCFPGQALSAETCRMSQNVRNICLGVSASLESKFEALPLGSSRTPRRWRCSRQPGSAWASLPRRSSFRLSLF